MPGRRNLTYWRCYGSAGGRSGVAGILALYFLLMVSQRVLFHTFIYWEVDPNRLRERRLWNTKNVLWQEVLHIGNWHRNQSSSDYLEIDYARAAPISDG